MISKIKILLAVFALFIYAESAMAQVPQMFNYQGIARDAKGNPLSNQKMSLKISVLPAADATTPEYEETQIVSTNEFGLYTLQIGNGTAVTGEMKTVKWETGNKYIKVAIDPAGGTNYTDAGTSQLLSVPYAIYADKAGTAANGGHDKTRTGAVSSNAAHVAGDANYITKFTALNTIGKSVIYESGAGNVGIGTAAPAAKFQITNTVAAVQEHIRMQNLSTTGAGRFTMYNDGVASYATFTKYGSAYAGGYAGIATMYPYANLLAFGNNGVAANDGQGRFLISTGGNVGISMLKGGTSKLKFHADFTTENVGIGGNAAPVNRVHLNNTDGTDMTVGVTNNTSGHTATDGLVIRENGDAASIMNMENSTLDLGTNNLSRMTIDAVGNVGIGTNAPSYKLDVLHGGATGIRSKSSSSFSVVDIDAFNGDAALRFQENGTGRWNTRNQPGTNDYQIFQLGGGGQRMIINSATGYIGVGSMASALNNLHVAGTFRSDEQLHVGMSSLGNSWYRGAFYNPNAGVGSALSLFTADAGNTGSDGAQFSLSAGANPDVEIANREAGGMRFYTNGYSEKMTISTDGNVGIGNTTPTSGKLVVHDSTQARVLDIVGTGTATVGQTVNISRNFAPAGGNDMLQISVPFSSPDDFQFIECDRGGINSFVVDGNGAVTFANALRPAGNSGSNGQVLRSAGSAAAPTWVNSNTLPGTIAFMGSTSGGTATPTATMSFLSNARVTVNITSATQVVQITTTVTLGSTAAGGANALNLYPAYNTNNAVTPVTTIGGGSLGLQCQQNTRNHYTLSYTVSGLAPGTYYFGMAGSSTSPNWTNNEFGYTSVTVMNN